MRPAGLAERAGTPVFWLLPGGYQWIAGYVSSLIPTFQIRITPELKAQFVVAAKDAGMSLGNWLKTLGRKELERLGMESKS